LIVQDLYDLGLTQLREIEYHETHGSEFYVTLGRHGNGAQIPRLEVLERIEAESAGAPVLARDDSLIDIDIDIGCGEAHAAGP